MAERIPEEMLERAWNNSVEYARSYSHRCTFEDCYLWLLDNPQILMALTPSQHEEMTRDYGNDSDYHFIKRVSAYGDFDAVINEIVQSI